jgi:hypothetical protein
LSSNEFIADRSAGGGVVSPQTGPWWAAHN